MARRTFLAAFLLFLCANLTLAMTPEERREYSRKLQEILTDPTRGNVFETWVQQSGELPPDFDSLPKMNGLPDPFTFFDGKRKVQTAEDWKARRVEILDLFQKYSWGTMPPKPTLDRIVPVDPAVAAAEAAARGRGGPGGRRGGGPATAPDGAVARGPASAPAGRAGRGAGRGGGQAPAEGTITKIVDLYYGPNSAIVQRVTVNIPPGPGPFPVLMGGNAGITSRGYISCTIPSNVDGPPNIAQHYPTHTWGAMAKCAWSTQMVVDYLHTLPEVDKRYIAITGYSRGGKYATICAAIDERITAVLAGSTGVGGLVSWRQGGEVNVAESIESTTRMFPIWFSNSFRFFSGREDRLPVDANLLAALVAPRALLSFYGLNDEVANTWGNEQTHHDALKVYQLLGHPDRLGLLRIDGVNKHHGANDAEATSRWLDIQFGKSTEKWTNNFLFRWDFEKWKQSSGEKVDINAYPRQATGPLATEGDGNALINSSGRWELRSDAIIRAVKWTLGDAPSDSELAKHPVTNPGDEGIDDTPRWVIGRSIIEHGWTRAQAEGIAVKDIRFGPGKIRGDIYYKQNTPAGTKLPTVVFLHGNSYPLGYMWVYRMDPHPIIALANAGYAVMAFDQTSYGSRMNEAATFYEKFPKWSQMGRMVADARAAVEAVRTDELCDGRKIYLFGYGTGGAVALHTAAMTQDVKGVISVCGFTPMRTDTPDKGTGGIARLYQDRGFLPRVGFFAGEESRIPYDYNELIATIAPRPVYVYSPEYNREATAADVKSAVEQARTVYQTQYNAGAKLVLDQPFDYFRLSLAAQDRIVAWMNQNMK